MVARLAVWSGPRNISTALMRSWENRPDTIVVDEPLFAHWLATTGTDHPGREDVLATYEHDWRRVVDELTGPVPEGVAVYYQKHMAHHLTPQVEHEWMTRLTNVLLIRDPREVVASYQKSRPRFVARDLGFEQLVELHEELATATGTAPPVVDAADFLRAPEAHLRALCSLVGVAFTERMLHWPAGPRDSDGVWAPHWYRTVWESTGFEPYRTRDVSLSGRSAEVAEECRPAYEQLYAVRLRP
ncbi:MAG TPA: HAD family hydrolase [Segeticoccus sp.]|jgi:hypothetical protein|nr:HAD family hydrolase [Segeticoccus sp.]